MVFGCWLWFWLSFLWFPGVPKNPSEPNPKGGGKMIHPQWKRKEKKGRAKGTKLTFLERISSTSNQRTTLEETLSIHVTYLHAFEMIQDEWIRRRTLLPLLLLFRLLLLLRLMRFHPLGYATVSYGIDRVQQRLQHSISESCFSQRQWHNRRYY